MKVFGDDLCGDIRRIEKPGLGLGDHLFQRLGGAGGLALREVIGGGPVWQNLQPGPGWRHQPGLALGRAAGARRVLVHDVGLCLDPLIADPVGVAATHFAIRPFDGDQGGRHIFAQIRRARGRAAGEGARAY